MDLNRDVYVEKQRGGLCRLHAINAFFGREELSEDDFNMYCGQYDKFYENISMPKAKDWDAVVANQENLIAFILKRKLGMGVIFAPPNHVKETLEQWQAKSILDLIDPSLERFFMFNASHVWVVLKANNKWKRVDSLSGIQNVNLQAVTSIENHGFMTVLPPKAMRSALLNIRHRIKDMIYDVIGAKTVFGFYTQKDITQFVDTELQARRGISKFELPLCSFYHILLLLYPRHISKQAFDSFFVKYQQKPSNLSMIMRFVPPLLHFICTYDERQH